MIVYMSVSLSKDCEGMGRPPGPNTSNFRLESLTRKLAEVLNMPDVPAQWRFFASNMHKYSRGMFNMRS